MSEENRNRKNRVEFRLNDCEYEKFILLKQKSGLTTVELMNRLIDNAKISEVPPVDFWELTKQIRYYGNNLNQIAKRANMFGVDDEAYQRNTKKVFDILDKLISSMLSKE